MGGEGGGTSFGRAEGYYLLMVRIERAWMEVRVENKEGRSHGNGTMDDSCPQVGVGRSVGVL